MKVFNLQLTIILGTILLYDLIYQLHAILDVYVIFDGGFCKLLEDHSNIVNFAQGLEERDVIIEASVFLVVVP